MGRRQEAKRREGAEGKKAADDTGVTPQSKFDPQAHEGITTISRATKETYRRASMCLVKPIYPCLRGVAGAEIISVSGCYELSN